MIRFFLFWVFMVAIDSQAALEPKILYEHDPTLLTTTIEVVVLTGSADDSPGKSGVTNLLGELVLRGTKSKDRTQFQSEIERLGAQLHVRVSHDMIVFVGKVIRENTARFLKLVEECLLKPAFSEKEFTSLKTEILAEIGYMKNNNNRLSGIALRREFFMGTALERPALGGLSTVTQIKRDDIIKAYNDNFSRGNMVFAVASSAPEAEIKDFIGKFWLAFPDGAKRQRRSLTLRTTKEPTLILVHKPDTSTGSLMLGQAGITAQDAHRYTLSTGNFSFGGEPLVSRLFKIIRGELGWTYYVGSTYLAMGGLSYQQGIYILSATPSVEHTTDTIIKLLAMWRDYLTGGLTKDELALAKESLVNSYPFDFDSAEKRLWQKLYSYLYNVPLLSPEEYAKTIGEVENQKLLDAIKKRHDPSGWVITVVADKTQFEKQLIENQKTIPADKQLKISKVYQPDDIVK